MRAFLLSLLVAIASLPAQGAGHPPSRTVDSKEEAASQVDVIGKQIDAALKFTDERGYPFELKQWFPGKQPVVLLLGYYSCPAMCGQVLDAAFSALSDVDLQPGEHYRVLNVSIDPKETPDLAKARKQSYLPRLRKTGGEDSWRVLVGDEENTKRLADQMGFRFYWSEATGQFAHPPSLIVLTPEGKVSRIIVNTAFDPSDVRLAIVEASGGALGSFWDQVRLNCLTFDAKTNTYSLAAMTLMRIAGAVTLVALAVMIWVMLRRERRQTTPAVA
jgi:protein SCO1/2